MSTTSLKLGWRVGSPLPEKVITSSFSLLACISRSFASSWSWICCTDGSLALPAPWALNPASQYRQSNEQILPSAGIRLMPRETPRRRECMGPKMAE